VGYNHFGTVSSSYATGDVRGANVVGGLVGLNDGAVSNSYATGNVTANSTLYYFGGLVGYNSGSISNSYATGVVSGANRVGGLAGLSSGTVSNSYAAGNVTGTSEVGGVLGYHNSGSVSNSYWNSNVIAIGIGFGATTGATGLTTAQMQQQSNFSSWDFVNTWIDYNGFTSPLLRSFMTPLTVTANNVAKTYDGQAYSGSGGVNYSSTPNANLLGTLNYSGTSQGATNAGTYAIAPGGLYSNQQGYLIGYADGALTVNPATLVLSGTRAYDGSSAVAGSVLTATGVAGETFAVTGVGDISNLASKNAQTASTLASVTGLALGTSGNGGLSTNYNALSTAGSSVGITAKALTVTVAAPAVAPEQSTVTSVFPVTLDMSKDQVLAIQYLAPPGMYVVPDVKRSYVDGSMFSQIVGYIGKVNKDDLSDHFPITCLLELK